MTTSTMADETEPDFCRDPDDNRPTAVLRRLAFLRDEMSAGLATLRAAIEQSGQPSPMVGRPDKFPNPLTARLGDGFLFEERDDVEQLLASCPQLVGLLLELREKVRGIFGDDSRVIVRPDESVGGHELVAYIATSLPHQAAQDALDRLDDEWWLDVLPRANCLLSLDLETRPDI